MFKHILVPTDGSPLSEKAVHAAIALASSTGGDVTGYACVPEYPISPFAEVLVEAPPDFQERCEREAREHLDQIELAAAKAGIRCNLHISMHSSPHVGIIEAAAGRGCDVIMMASSHGRRLQHLLMGSETQRVLENSRIPVIVYR